MKNVTAYVEKNTVPFDKAVVFEELKGASYNPRQQRKPLSSVLSTGESGNLAERIRAGDTPAETELVHRFGRRIFVMAVVRTHDRETANELVQDVLMAVIGALRRGQLLIKRSWRPSCTAQRET